MPPMVGIPRVVYSFPWWVSLGWYIASLRGVGRVVYLRICLPEGGWEGRFTLLYVSLRRVGRGRFTLLYASLGMVGGWYTPVYASLLSLGIYTVYTASLPTLCTRCTDVNGRVDTPR